MYATSKAALDGMTRSLAMEHGPRGVRANTVAPGVVDVVVFLASDASRSITGGVIAADGGIHPTVNLRPTV